MVYPSVIVTVHCKSSNSWSMRQIAYYVETMADYWFLSALEKGLLNLYRTSSTLSTRMKRLEYYASLNI